MIGTWPIFRKPKRGRKPWEVHENSQNLEKSILSTVTAQNKASFEPLLIKLTWTFKSG